MNRFVRPRVLLVSGLVTVAAAAAVVLVQYEHESAGKLSHPGPLAEGFSAGERRAAAAFSASVVEGQASAATAQKPVSDGVDVADLGPPLPAQLASFLLTKSSAYLEYSPGILAQAGVPLPVDPARWRDVAAIAAADPEAARLILLWLSAQQQPSAYLALATFWSELARQSADYQFGQGVLLESMPLPAMSLLMPSLTRLDSLPEPVLQDFHRRISTGEISYADVMTMVSRAVDADQVRMALALGGPTAPLDAIFAARFADRATQQAAIDIAAGQPDAAMIDRLLSQAQSGNVALATFMAEQWAPRQLSGDRLAYVGQLFRAGAFAGAGQSVLVALLANAEDREAAESIAAGAGIALPPPSPSPK